ncbi:MAG: hypothetical protein EOP93_00435 [Lysobacteraceae bacterium]|nr:MAG: hypothetical protein EOP93_00435 [Xanthomonadaceae bacterium]
MALHDLMRRRMLVAAALAGVVVGVVVGLFLPIRAAAPPKSDESSWSLPSAQEAKRFRNDQFQSVRSARFWGEIKQTGARGPQAVAWSLSAIVTHPMVSIAVTVPGKPAVSWIQPGSVLPDGATFVAANRDTVWYEKDGCRRARKLYTKPTVESEACIGAKDEPAATPAGSPAPAPAATSPAAPPARTPL